MLTKRDSHIKGLFELGLTPAQIGKQTGKSKRTIERERKLGLVEQARQNPTNKKYEPLYITEWVYKADAAQRRHDERTENKGNTISYAQWLPITRTARVYQSDRKKQILVRKWDIGRLI